MNGVMAFNHPLGSVYCESCAKQLGVSVECRQSKRFKNARRANALPSQQLRLIEVSQ
jgi:hypothetical protein